MLSRDVTEPPDCLSVPGLALAASTNSLSVLNGESVRTAISAGSCNRPATGVRSCKVTLASRVTRALAIQALETTPSVCGSPFFSAMAAAATAPLPPGRLRTCMRTGNKFSFSSIWTMARASTSLPPPGAVCTITSIGLLGFHWACASPAKPAMAAMASEQIVLDSFMVVSG